MENFYNSLQQSEPILQFVKIDGLYLTGKQMRKIANDKTVLVQWRDEWIHLCRCESISNIVEYHIAHSGKVQSIRHIQGANGSTLCNKKYAPNWIIETRLQWIRRCKMCETLIDKES